MSGTARERAERASGTVGAWGGGTSWAAALEQAREERETGCAREKRKREWAERAGPEREFVD